MPCISVQEVIDRKPFDPMPTKTWRIIFDCRHLSKPFEGPFHVFHGFFRFFLYYSNCFCFWIPTAICGVGCIKGFDSVFRKVLGSPNHQWLEIPWFLGSFVLELGVMKSYGHKEWLFPTWCGGNKNPMQQKTPEGLLRKISRYIFWLGGCFLKILVGWIFATSPNRFYSLHDPIWRHPIVFAIR